MSPRNPGFPSPPVKKLPLSITHHAAPRHSVSLPTLSPALAPKLTYSRYPHVINQLNGPTAPRYTFADLLCVSRGWTDVVSWELSLLIFHIPLLYIIRDGLRE